jgi:hypothetical protein
MRGLLALLIVSSCLLGAAEPQNAGSWKKRWAISIAAMAAASLLDAATSTGKIEQNPLLRNSQGQFCGGRAAAYKSAAAGGLVALELLFARKDPALYKASTVVNFATAGAFTAMAWRNRSVPRAPVESR